MARNTPAPDTQARLLDALEFRIGVRRERAADVDLALRAAVRAVLPGRQQKGNLEPVMDAARKAFVRTLRRRVKGPA